MIIHMRGTAYGKDYTGENYSSYFDYLYEHDSIESLMTEHIQKSSTKMMNGSDNNYDIDFYIVKDNMIKIFYNNNDHYVECVYTIAQNGQLYNIDFDKLI